MTEILKVPNVQKRFKERLDTRSDEYIVSNYHDVESTDDLLLSSDETTIFVGGNRDSFGVCNFTDYDDENEWSFGWAEWDEQRNRVYAFNDPEYRDKVVIDATLLENVAEILDTTAEIVADSVKTYRGYPVLVPGGSGKILIAPLLNVSNLELED